MKVDRLNLVETFIAAIVLATVVFLGWPAITQSSVQGEKSGDFAPCGCPEIAKTGCEQPCMSCCDDPATPVAEPCPCTQPDPTHEH